MANELHVHHAEPRSEWIQQIRAGDEGAFEHLFRTYAPGLCAFLTRHVESPAAAEDIVQELFLTLWRKRETIWIDGPVSTYLLRAAKNRALNHLRGSQVRERFRVTHLAQADERSEEAELLAALDLQEAIAHLPPRCRVIFTLNRQQGFSYREIADDLGLSVKTVDSQIQRATKSLRAWVQRTQ